MLFALSSVAVFKVLLFLIESKVPPAKNAKNEYRLLKAASCCNLQHASCIIASGILLSRCNTCSLLRDVSKPTICSVQYFSTHQRQITKSVVLL